MHKIWAIVFEYCKDHEELGFNRVCLATHQLGCLKASHPLYTRKIWFALIWKHFGVKDLIWVDLTKCLDKFDLNWIDLKEVSSTFWFDLISKYWVYGRFDLIWSKKCDLNCASKAVLFNFLYLVHLQLGTGLWCPWLHPLLSL